MGKKEISQMTVEEMKQEIRTYPCEEDENFVFVSYSHKDAELVYRKVLEWQRMGYNLYIDLDFENHGSDKNWVTIMNSHLSNNNCVMAVCFRSEHYEFSYAVLLELLTMRSAATIKSRYGSAEEKVPIDVIVLNRKKDEKQQSFSSPEIKKMYKQCFQDMYADLGEVFGKANYTELEKLESGMASWIDSIPQIDMYNKIRGYSAKDRIEDLKADYSRGYNNFYPRIRKTIQDWFITCDLNGNTKDYGSSGVVTRFVELGVYKKEEEEGTPEYIAETVSEAVSEKTAASKEAVTETVPEVPEKAKQNTEKADKAKKTKKPAEETMPAVEAETIAAAPTGEPIAAISMQTTIGEFRRLMENEAFAAKVGEIQKNLPRNMKSPLALLMMPILGGDCNYKTATLYQVNYLKNVWNYQPSAKDSSAWSWSSMSCKHLSDKKYTSSPWISKEFPECVQEYKSLPEDTTLQMIYDKFKKRETRAFAPEKGSENVLESMRILLEKMGK